MLQSKLTKLLILPISMTVYLSCTNRPNKIDFNEPSAEPTASDPPPLDQNGPQDDGLLQPDNAPIEDPKPDEKEVDETVVNPPNEPDPPLPPDPPVEQKSFCIGPSPVDPNPLAQKGSLNRFELPEPRPAFLEGALWLDDEQVLLASSMQSGGENLTKIVKWLPDDRKWDLKAFGSRGSLNTNGMAITLDKQILAALYKPLKGIARIKESETTADHLIKSQSQITLLSPNDLTVRNDGTIFFTDPDYQNESKSPQDKPSVFRLNQNGSLALIDDSLQQPNGITLSLDQKTLYVGTASGTIVSFSVAADGSTQKLGIFARTGQGVDGMTIDCAGNLYATAGKEIQIYNQEAKLLGKILLFDDATNVAFGGKDRKTLFITSFGALYSIELSIPGWPY